MVKDGEFVDYLANLLTEIQDAKAREEIAPTLSTETQTLAELCQRVLALEAKLKQKGVI